MSTTSGGVQPAHDPLIQPNEAAVQAAAIRRVRGRSTRPAQGYSPTGAEYAGLVTRAVALALDAAIVNGVAALVGVTVGLALSILHFPSQLDAVVAALTAATWVIWSVSYFAFFWATTGQTPGDRVMSICVIDRRGRGPIKPFRAVVRFAGLILAALPLCAGFLIMLWDDRRRCLQDRLAHTVVIYAPSARAPGPSPRSLRPGAIPSAPIPGAPAPPTPMPPTLAATEQALPTPIPRA